MTTKKLPSSPSKTQKPAAKKVAATKQEVKAASDKVIKKYSLAIKNLAKR